MNRLRSGGGFTSMEANDKSNISKRPKVRVHEIYTSTKQGER